MRTDRLMLVLLLMALTPCASAPAQMPARTDTGASQIAQSLPKTALGDELVRSSTETPQSSLVSSAPNQPQGLDYSRVLAALGIVIGLIFVLRWFGRFFFPAATGRARGRAVEVLSRSPISHKQQIMLLRVGQRLIVVGDSGGQLSSLCEITDSDEVAAMIGQLRDEKLQIPKRAFGAMFGKSRQEFDAEATGADVAPSELREPEENDAPVASAREELSGLRDRVRLLAEQFKGA